MTNSDAQAGERAEQEAAVWLVTLAEDSDDTALQAAFQDWLDASPLHEAAWDRTRLAYDFIGRGQPVFADRWQTAGGPSRVGAAAGNRAGPDRHAAGAVAAGMGRGARRPLPARRGVRLSALGLAAAAAIIVAIVLFPGLLPSRSADYATATAEVQTVPLADGSVIHLAPDSAIAVAVTEAGRRVELIDGQAFLEVAPDPERPFEVAAGDARVVVLGTAFDVRRSAGQVRVGVRHGHVRVADTTTGRPTEADLRSGDWIDLENGVARRGSGPPEDVGSWLQGRLVARDRPAGEVVDALRRYYDGVIVVRDPEFAARRVSGLYDLRDPARTLADLAASHGAAVWRPIPWLMVVRGN